MDSTNPSTAFERVLIMVNGAPARHGSPAASANSFAILSSTSIISIGSRVGMDCLATGRSETIWSRLAVTTDRWIMRRGMRTVGEHDPQTA